MKTFRQLFAVASLLLAVCLPARAAVVITNINLGSAANDGTGDTLRGALTKAMTNFHRLNYGKIESTNGAGTAGNVLTSDGTNWYGAAPTGSGGTGAVTNASTRDFHLSNGILSSKNLSANHRWVYYDDFNQPMTTPGVFPDSPTGHKYNVFTGGGGNTNLINLVDGKWWMGGTGAVYQSVTYGTNGVYGSAAPINSWGGTFSYQRSTNNTPDGYEQNLFLILSPQVDFLPTNYLHITIGANIFRVQRELSATNIIYAQHFGGRYLAFDTNHSFTITIISNNIIAEIAGMRYVGYDESLSTTYGNIKVATYEAIGSPTNQFWAKWDSQYWGYALNSEHWQYAGPFAVRSNGVLSRVTSTNFTLSVDDAYASGWNGSLDVPSKNAIYDKIETLGTGSSSGSSNSIPVVTITTNVNIGFGTIQSLAMTTPSNQFLNFQGTETNGDTVELAVTNSAATNITITFNLDGTTSSYYDPTAGTNRSSFVVSPGGKILTFVYSTNWGAIWRLNAYLGLELEIAPGTNITFTTNGALVTIASSASGGGAGSFAANANQFDTNNSFSLKRQANLTNPIVWGVISETNWINVRAYGAVGDGVTDDATAFKAAFTNPLVYVPAGRYLIGSAMAKTNGIVRGDGPARTVLLQNFNGILINTITPAQRVSFYDMEFDGQGGSDYSGGGAIGSRYAVQAYGMGLNNFERLHFRNYSGDALYIDSVVSTDTSRDSVVGVFNCYFSNCWSGISLKTSEYARVIGNAIDECSYGLVLGAANAHVSANRIIDCYQGVNVSQIFSSVRGHNMLVGNSMNHCTYPLVAKGATGMTVTGNELMGNGTVWFTNASGINFIGNLCELNGFRFEGGTYNAVKNNTFYSGTTPTFTHNYAGATSYTRVEGNANELGASVPVSPTLTLVAGSRVTNAMNKVMVIGSGGAVTLTSTPSVNTNAIPDGTIIQIMGTHATSTLTIQDNGTLADSKCELGASTRVLGLGDTLSLQYDWSLNKWFEVGWSDN